MRIPSLIGLLGALQQRGLTAQHLTTFVALCQARHTGAVVFHLREGRIQLVEGMALRQGARDGSPEDSERREAWALR
jgi:hypothetical protein